MSTDYPDRGRAPVWGVELTPDQAVGSIASLATRAESTGFDTIFVSNHYNNRDVWLTLGRIAAATTEINLGPGVVNPYSCHPVQLASAAATLQEDSGGRAVFGIGAGDSSTLATLGIERDQPVARVAESIEILSRLWAGETVAHTGTVTASNASFSYDCQALPIYVGGQGPSMVRLAAARADGLLANAAHPDDYEWMIEHVAAGEERRDASKTPCHIVAFASVSVAEQRAAALEAARPPVAFIVSGAPERVIDRHGIDHTTVAEVRNALEAGDHPKAYELVTEPMIDAFCVAGTPQQVADRIANLHTYVDGFVAASPLGPDRQQAIDLLGKIRESLDIGHGRQT